MRRAHVLLLLLVCLACKQPEVRRDDEGLKRTLATIRAALESFRKDNGRYPHTLDELVPQYLPSIPADPVTGSATTWRLVTEESVQPSADFTKDGTAAAHGAVIIDVRSGAGAHYSNY